MTSKRPLIIAHRGASAEAPENTLHAFDLALREIQSDMIEFDVRLTRDKVPVIIHDPRVDRITNGCGSVHHYTWDEIQKLDAGYHFDPQGNQTFPFRGRGCKIPRLEEIFERYPDTPFVIEIKIPSRDLVSTVACLLKKHKCLETSFVGSSRYRVSHYLRKSYPEMNCLCSRLEIIGLLFEKALRKSLSPGNFRQTASTPLKSSIFSFDTESWTDFLHRKGMKSFFWTVDDSQTMLRLVQIGADGVVTNDPRKARKIL